MKLKFLIVLIAILFNGVAYGQVKKTVKTKKVNKNTIGNKKSKKLPNYYPFVLTEVEGNYGVRVAVESKEIISVYQPLFEKYGYSGSGYCWEGHIIQILEKLNPDLINHLDMDAEAGGFFMNADSKENQIKFVELLSPIFSDLKKLGAYVEKADKTRIDD